MIVWIVGFVGSMDRSRVRADVVLVKGKFMSDEFFKEFFKGDGFILPISSINDLSVCFIVQTSQTLAIMSSWSLGFPMTESWLVRVLMACMYSVILWVESFVSRLRLFLICKR